MDINPVMNPDEDINVCGDMEIDVDVLHRIDKKMMSCYDHILFEETAYVCIERRQRRKDTSRKTTSTLISAPLSVGD